LVDSTPSPHTRLRRLDEIVDGTSYNLIKGSELITQNQREGTLKRFRVNLGSESLKSGTVLHSLTWSTRMSRSGMASYRVRKLHPRILRNQRSTKWLGSLEPIARKSRSIEKNARLEIPKGCVRTLVWQAIRYSTLRSMTSRSSICAF
jgi:hypothetical protein